MGPEIMSNMVQIPLAPLSAKPNIKNGECKGNSLDAKSYSLFYTQ
jgi:hypothetical protein